MLMGIARGAILGRLVRSYDEQSFRPSAREIRHHCGGYRVISHVFRGLIGRIAVLVVAAQLKPFQAKEQTSRRLRNLCWTPYFTDGILAGLGGLLNPAGLFYVIASALPSTLGANAGLLSLPSMMRRMDDTGEEQVRPIQGSLGWVSVGAVASLLFVFVLGRGITWSR